MALFSPTPLAGCRQLSDETVKSDRAAAQAFGPVALGRQAVYFRGFPAPRYVPLSDIRVAYLRMHEANGGGDFDIDASYAGFVVECAGREKEVFYSEREAVERLLKALQQAGVRAGVGAQKE